MSRADLRTILYLQRRIVFNWFRRSMRSPFFWIVGAFVLFILVMQVAAVIDGPDEPMMTGWTDSVYLAAIAVVALGAGVLVGIWRGTTNTPSASLAHVVLMTGSPITPRLQFSVLMFRDGLINALVIGLWSLAAASGAILGVDDPWIAVRVFFMITTIILLSEFLRNAVWVGTEQIVARDQKAGRRLRGLVKLLTLGLVAGGIATLFAPILRGGEDNLLAAVEAGAERAEMLSVVPPFSFAVGALTPGGASVLHGLGLTSMTIGVAVLALYWARDFAEPIAVAAERKTDARGQILEAGSDVQWAVLTQYGVSPRMRASVRPFGGGPWALIWGAINRWVRYQIAAAWITIVIMGLLGLATAIGVRIGYISVEIAWAVVLIFPFFGSVNMFMDELRRQFIFLIPGSSWARLAAGAVSSVLDGVVSSAIMIGLLLAVGVIPPGHAGGLALLSVGIALLAQASLALVQILLPFWVGQRIRVSMTFGVTGLGFLPALGLLIALYISVGPLTGLIAAAVASAVVGAIILVVAGFLFDRVEYSG